MDILATKTQKMKTLSLFTLTMILTISSLHAQQSYGIMDAGYSTQSTSAIPVFAFTLGRKFCSDDYRIAPVAEIGFRAHMDQESDHNAYGHISAGLQYNNFLALTAGCIYGGNQKKQDRHMMDDTVITLSDGASGNHYISYQLALRGMQTVMKKDNGSPFLQVVEQVTYGHAVWYGSIGFRFSLFD